MSFNGFISYSHAADGRLAPAVQRGLHRLAKPWHRRRALWIFRDQTGLAVTPTLWTSIQRALDDSEYFVLMASPEAAQSPWVNREIEHWVATRPADRILPVVTDGDWCWDPEAGDFDAGSTAVPPALRGVFAEEPLYLDLRWARDDQHLSLRHTRFRDAIAQLAAPMHGVSKDDLEGEDVRQHRRAGRLRFAAVLSLMVLSGLALLAGMSAAHNAAEASAAVLKAQAQEREATAQRGSAARFADEAERQEDEARFQEARAQSAATEADRQERLAREQQGAAEQASAEVARQTASAERAAARARVQERLAQRQVALAEASAREMKRQEQRAREQERIAREQEKLAAAAAAEAARQQEIAREQEKLADDARAEAAKQQGNAERQQRIAIGRRLVNEARAAIEDDPQTAVRLGIAAQRISPEAETRRDVAGLITSTRHAGAVGAVRQVEHGPDGLLATVDMAGTVSLHDVRDRARPKRLSSFGEGNNWDVALALSPTGRTLVVIRSGRAELWDVSRPSRPAVVGALPGDQHYPAAKFSADGHTLVIGNSYGDRPYATLWDVSDPAEPVVLSQLTDGAATSGVDFGFSADGRTLAADIGHVVLWDISDRRNPQVRASVNHGSLLRSMALAPSGKTLAVADMYSNGLGLWDLTDLGSPRYLGTAPGLTGSVGRVEFSPDGTLLGATDEERVVVWEVGDYSPRELGRVASPGGFLSLSFSPDDRTLATADLAETARLWTITEFAAPERAADVVVPGGWMQAMWYAPDGRSAITVGRDGNAVVWGLRGNAEPSRGATVPLFDGELAESAAISPDGRFVAAGRYNRPVTLVDLEDPDRPRSVNPGFAKFKVDRFSPDGRLLVITGYANLQLWDVADRKRPAMVTELSFRDVIGRTAISPDGRTLAVSSANTVTLWDITDRARPARLAGLAGHGGGVASLTFSPDGRTVATTSHDRTAILWDVTDRTTPGRLTTLTGHTGTVTALAFSADGQTVATVGTESWAMVWDIGQASRPVRLARVKLDHYWQTQALAFGPDARTLAVGTSFGDRDARVSIYDATALDRLRADPSSLGCALAVRGLTRQEWARYVPDLDYQQTCG